MHRQTSGGLCPFDDSCQLHKRLKVSEQLVDKDLGRCNKDVFCDNHTDKNHYLFCLECKVAACIECWDKLHRAHKFSDADSVTDKLQQQMETDFCNLTDGADHCRDVLQAITDKRNDLCDQIARADAEICRTANNLQNVIEQHKQQALASLSSAKQAHMHEADSLYHGVEQQLSMIENLKSSVKEMASAGNAIGQAHEITAFHRQSEKLLRFDAVQNALQNLNSVDITFAASETMANGNRNMVGTVSEVSALHMNDASQSPILTHVIPRGVAVVGMTLVDNQLFVARWPSQQQLEVYNAETFIFHRPLAVHGLSGRPGGLTSCALNYCLYVSDFKNSVLFRVGLSCDHKAKLMHWSVDRQPTGLSVNSERNVLVTCRGSPHKIQEYTSQGTLVRDIRLPLDVARPMHAVQLDAGHIVVAHGGTLPGQFGVSANELHRICLLDTDGNVVSSYGSTCGLEHGRLDEPMHLTINKNGFILAAIKENHRVVVLNSSLSGARDLSLPVTDGLKGPISLYLDEAHNRLYVGEGIGGRLLVFDNVINIGEGLN